jgi:hypothetical protein
MAMSTASPPRGGLITIASVPANHVYVRHLSAPDGSDAVRRLDDPRPCSAPSDQSVWWPPVMLDPQWIDRHHTEFDVFHLHFGFDAQTVQNLREVVSALRAHHKPLVFTVHDLRNPHHREPAAHEGHLDVLVPAADQLITLTPGAAAVTAERWGRVAQVLPHPHVVEPAGLGQPRRLRDEFVIGVHLKSLRANIDCLPVLETLADVVDDLPGAALRVDLHTEVLAPEGRHHRPDVVGWLQAAQHRGAIRLHVHDFFSDGQLWTYLRDEIDVSVLPYRFGTHSGWLEACYDLGTMVAAPDCGFYAQQRPCFGYGHNDESGLDAGSLVAAVRAAYEQRPYWQATIAERRAERCRVAAAHRDLYARAAL